MLKKFRANVLKSQVNKKLCFYPSSLPLDERLDLLFQHCKIKFNWGGGVLLFLILFCQRLQISRVTTTFKVAQESFQHLHFYGSL